MHAMMAAMTAKTANLNMMNILNNEIVKRGRVVVGGPESISSREYLHRC